MFCKRLVFTFFSCKIGNCHLFIIIIIIIIFRIINLLCGWKEERNENGPLRERNIVMAER
jgi:hypothetical protein